MLAPAVQVTLLFTDIEGSTTLWERDANNLPLQSTTFIMPLREASELALDATTVR